MAKKKKDTDGKGYRPRLSVEIREDQYHKLEQLIPWGMQKPLFEAIVDDLIAMLDDNPNKQMILGAIITRNVHLWDLLNIPEKED